MKTEFLLVSILLFLFACQQETFYDGSENVQSYSISIEKDSSFVDLELARHVASTSVKHSSRSVSDVAEDVFIVKDKDSLPALYIVNNANKQGYSIVSATKNYHPILAWSDRGYLNPASAPEVVDFYLNSFCNNVECLRNAPYDNNGTKSVDVSSRSISPDVQWFMDYSRIQWQNEGYEVTSLSSNEFSLPTSVYENALFTAELFMREDFMETSFIVRKMEVETTEIPAMLDTEWGQWIPYNNKVWSVYGFCPTGCVAVALAQIMKYHEKPQTYDWDAMPPAANNSNVEEVSQLMYDIGLGVDMIYTEEKAETTPDKAVAYLRSIGYNNASLVSHSANTVKTQIHNYRPVYMGGIRLDANNERIGHAWVCDGYRENYGRTAYYLMTLDSQELRYYSNEIFFDSEWGSTYYHMNWGYVDDDNVNGWYRDTHISFNLEGVTYNYNINRQDIINIY